MGMQVLGIVLILISLGTTVAPVAAALVIYRDDLSQLVITPQLRDIMNGNSAILPAANNNNDNGNQNGNVDDQGLAGLINPTLVSVQSDIAARTFSAVFSITNPTNYDLTLNSFSANALMTEQQIPAGSISLTSPVSAPAGQTTQVTMSGQWTQQIQDYMLTNFSSMNSVEIYVKDVVIDVNGVTVTSSGIMDVGNVPFSMVG
jgi:hypothetical protein